MIVGRFLNGVEIDFDVVVIGAGPGGMTAGIYAGRANLEVGVIERGVPGGQMMNTAEIENYPGYKTIMGADLSTEMFGHMSEAGAKYVYGNVVGITDHGFYKEIDLGSKVVRSLAVIIATGAEYRKLGIVGEEELRGRGVSYCAVCDGAFFKEKDIIVVGGGDSAVEEAVYLTKYAKSVRVLHRRDAFRAQKVLQDRLFANDKISVEWNTKPLEIVSGDSGSVGGVIVEDTVTGEQRRIDADAVFVYVGMDPISKFAEGLGVLNESGYVETDRHMATSVPGIFAVGDVRDTVLRQVITAAGDGSIAGQAVSHYVEGVLERLK